MITTSKKIARLLLVMAIAASSLLAISSASAIGSIYDGTSGDIPCITSGQQTGYFTIINNIVTDSSRCRGSVVIPSGVTAVADNAFAGDKDAIFIESLSISNTVTTIGVNAFKENYLTTLTIPGSVNFIDGYAFYTSNRLENLTIESGVTNIGYLAFRNSNQLTSVILPNSVTSVGIYAFSHLPALINLSISENLTTLGNLAFGDLPSLSTYSYCGSRITAENLDSAGLSEKKRLACPAVITAGSEPNSQVVTFPTGVKVAEIPTSSSLPAIKLTFAATAPESLTVITTTNPASVSATPFMTSGSPRIVDIRIANHDGSNVTVCLEGASTDLLYHYTGGAWVELGGRSYDNGQVCGVTNSFSPFTAAPAKPVTNPASASEAATAIAAAEKAAAEAAAAKREAERRDARTEILRRYKGSEAVTVETYQKAEIAGITSSNVDEINKEILRLPIEQRGDLAEISKVARKYEVVGLIGSDRVKSDYPSQFIEIGLISADSKIKSTLVKAVSNLADIQRSSYEAIKAAIEAKTAEIQARKDRLAKVLSRSSTRSGK